MNTMLNYVIEANLILVVCYLVYLLVLRHETDFRMMRLFLLFSLIGALVFPLAKIDLGQNQSFFSLGAAIPTYWLPEIAIGGTTPTVETSSASKVWRVVAGIYGLGILILSFRLLSGFSHLWPMLKRTQTYRYGRVRIAESNDDLPTFSFFNFILIGRAKQLSPAEKRQIILHESVHVHQWHSVDILLLNILEIFFWFNPLIYQYKKTFIQVHEFEADARAAEHTDLNEYCNLLARLALQSAGLRLANHFHNSLTIKRIEMMKTVKSSLVGWKVVVLTVALPIVFLAVACQDQVSEEVTDIAKGSSHALVVPGSVQDRFDQLKRENPDKHYALLRADESASQRIEALQQQHGLPKSIEVYKIGGDEPLFDNEGNPIVSGQASKIIVEGSPEGRSTYVILEFNDQAKSISESSKTDGVYTVVEEQPEFVGGYDALVEYMRENIRYPADARQEEKQGTVYVNFIVQADGSVTDAGVVRGVSPSLDAEALRVVQGFPKWNPGKQSGREVAVRFVLPVKFTL